MGTTEILDRPKNVWSSVNLNGLREERRKGNREYSKSAVCGKLPGRALCEGQSGIPKIVVSGKDTRRLTVRARQVYNTHCVYKGNAPYP